MVCGVLVVAKDSEVLIESHISFWNSCHLHSYICMYSVYVDTPTERLTDRQTDRQTLQYTPKTLFSHNILQCIFTTYGAVDLPVLSATVPFPFPPYTEDHSHPAEECSRGEGGLSRVPH